MQYAKQHLQMIFGILTAYSIENLFLCVLSHILQTLFLGWVW